MPTLQGTIQDANGSFCQRLVRAYRRDTGALVAEGLSHPATGAFSLTTADTSKHYVVVHDNDAWITYLPMLGAHNSTLFGEWGGKAVTAYGDARLSTTESKFGGSAAYFDGNGDYLSLPASADLAFGTCDFTLDAWVRLDSLGVERALFDNRAAAGDTGLYFGIDAANHLTVFGNNTSLVTGNVALTAATWHHVALVRAAGTMTLYRDGLPVGSAAAAYAITCPGPVLIGRKLGSSSNDFAGYLDEFIVRKGLAQYITPTASLFTQNTGDPLWNATILACHFDGLDGATTLIDEKGNVLTAMGNAQISTTESKFGGSCLRLDGASDYVVLNANILSGYSGDITIECWFKLAAIPSGNDYNNSAYVFSYGPNNLNPGCDFYIGSTHIKFSHYDYAVTVLSGLWTADTNWHHLAVVRMGNEWLLFFDGVIINAATNSNAFFTHIGYLTIGACEAQPGGVNTGWLNGCIDDIRFTKAARYVDHFIPPVAPFANSLQTWGQQNALIYDHLTPV